MKDLLIDHCNSILRARYFGVIFDTVPNYSLIECGSAEIEKIPGVNELFRLSHSGIVSLVQEIHSSWNQIEYSLNLMYEKLVELGFVCIDGQIEIVDPETEESLYHV